jgi:hypothetical protein
MPGDNVSDTSKPIHVSPNNPCPFLRALVGEGMLSDDVAGIGEVTDTIMEVAKTGDGSPDLPAAAIRAIALAANGFGPLDLAHNALGGLRLNALRNGPLDKKGVGSGILAANGKVDQAELDRLDQFATDHAAANGKMERGLGADELKRMMDANFDRAEGHRRCIDRRMMDAEWPILLQVMGKQGKEDRYLSLKEVRQLFKQRKLPKRMSSQLTWE